MKHTSIINQVDHHSGIDTDLLFSEKASVELA